MTFTNDFIEDLQSPEVEKDKENIISERVASLEEEFEALESGLRGLAWGVFLIVISSGVSVLLMIMSAAEKVTCVLNSEASCSSDVTSTAGWVVLCVGMLFGLALVLGATTRSRRQY